jgi:hypothetical protein
LNHQGAKDTKKTKDLKIMEACQRMRGWRVKPGNTQEGNRTISSTGRDLAGEYAGGGEISAAHCVE